MSSRELATTAQALMAEGKGLLAMDESNPTCNKRFAELGIPQTEEMRRAYRQLIVTTRHLGDFISGAILYDETIRQRADDGTLFTDLLVMAGIVPGIKVDMGTQELPGFPGEKITEGLDGLGGRLKSYAAMGARFAKWRAVITIGPAVPTPEGIAINVHALARYAALCQQEGIVPIVEPEVLMDGDHTLERCFEVTDRVLHALFHELDAQRVDLEGTILKPNMVLPGKDCPRQSSVEEVADATVGCLRGAAPATVAGVAFLSGGQKAELASARLDAMNRRFKDRLPWPVTFSFSRAVQQPALEVWRGRPENASRAQQALLHRLRCNGAARRGQYNPAMESEGA